MGNTIVVCNGGFRTGSTLVFNICLEIASQTGIAGNTYRSIGSNHQGVTSLCQLHKDFLINWWFIKSHDFIPGEYYSNLKILHTDRNPYSTARSLKRIFPDYSDEQISDLVVNQKLNSIFHQKRRDSLVVPYEMLLHDMKSAIIKVSHHLGARIHEHQIAYINDKLSVKNVQNFCEKIAPGRADSFTQFRHGHISEKLGSDEGWEEALSDSLVEMINVKLKNLNAN